MTEHSVPAGRAGTPGATRGSLRTRIATALRHLHDLTGEGAYRAYVTHHERTHPGEPVMREREFWRQKYADEDANPGSRCC